MNDIITVAVVNGSNLHTGNILRFIYGVQKRSNNVMDIVKFHEFIVRHILLWLMDVVLCLFWME